MVAHEVLAANRGLPYRFSGASEGNPSVSGAGGWSKA